MSLRGVSERPDALTTSTKGATLTSVFSTFNTVEGEQSACPIADPGNIRERDLSIG